MIAFLFIALAGFFNSIMDKIRFHWKKSIFSNIKNPRVLDWVSPKLSWDNKWKSVRAEKEKFPGSSTVFVWLTDLWHFAQFMMICCFILAALFYVPVLGMWWDFIIMYTIFGTTFELFYSKVWSKKVQ